MHLTISVLGSLQISLEGNPTPRFRFERVRALLVYLVLEGDEAHDRAALVNLLWGDISLKAGQDNLRQTLAMLRQVLNDKDQETPFILSDAKSLRFNPASSYTVDLHRFNHLIEITKKHKHRRLGGCASCIWQLEQAVALYRGPFLDGFGIDSHAFEDWGVRLATKVHDQVMWALSELTECYLHRKDYLEAAQTAERQLALDSLCDKGHHGLMEALSAGGQRSRALLHYHEYQSLLSQELGIVPPAATRKLHEQLIADEWSLPPANNELHNLSGEVVPLVGHEIERAYLTERLASVDCRLLTLVGPGGSGKSCLANWVAHHEISNFRDGVYWVDLATCTPESLLETIASVIPFTPVANLQLLPQLIGWLKDKEILLILDKFEHLTSQSLTVLRLLRAAPALNILVTSREWLMLKEETVLHIQGLNFPIGTEVEQIEQYASIQFFVQCLRRLRPNFTHLQRQEDRDAVIRLCQFVDGLPLALELLTYWHEWYTLPEIAARVERGVDLFYYPCQPQTEYHPSIREIFNSTWSQLSPAAQRLFARLCVFRDGFSLEAAKLVAQASPEVLMELQMKSLVRPVRRLAERMGSAQTPAGLRRYKIPGLYRHYGLNRLNQNPQVAQTVKELHCQYYLNVLNSHLEEIDEEKRAKARPLLRLERENFRQARQWAYEQRQLEKMAQIELALSHLQISSPAQQMVRIP